MFELIPVDTDPGLLFQFSFLSVYYCSHLKPCAKQNGNAKKSKSAASLLELSPRQTAPPPSTPYLLV